MLKSKRSVSVFYRNFQSSSLKKQAIPLDFTSNNEKNVVLIEAVRTPFMVSNSKYKSFMAVDLQRHALIGLLDRVKIPYNKIGHIVCGTVIQECRTSNIAREAALLAGFSNKIPCSTVSLACISSNLSTYNINLMIKSGDIEAGIAGGVELLSDLPIRYNKKVRESLISLQKAKTMPDKLNLGKTILANILTPDLPSVSEFSSNETMGHSADRLAAAFGVGRREQDEYAIRSHTLASQAGEQNKLTDVLPYFGLNDKSFSSLDNGIRVSTLDKLSTLKPAFVKGHGTVTAGNSSFLTDGASAALFSSEDFALKNGYKPKAFIRDIKFVAIDPKDQLLLGPAYAIPKILEKTGLSIKDIDLFEIHEAFAGQVLANLRALDSDWFCKTYMNRKGKFGSLPMEKLNKWGGSLSIGHPFGATGIRLISHAANRLIDEGGRYAIVAACAAGGHGVGMLIETYPQK